MGLWDISWYLILSIVQKIGTIIEYSAILFKRIKTSLFEMSSFGDLLCRECTNIVGIGGSSVLYQRILGVDVH